MIASFLFNTLPRFKNIYPLISNINVHYNTFRLHQWITYAKKYIINKFLVSIYD